LRQTGNLELTRATNAGPGGGSQAYNTNYCGTPDEPKPCPPMPRHPLKTIQATSNSPRLRRHLRDIEQRSPGPATSQEHSPASPARKSAHVGIAADDAIVIVKGVPNMSILFGPVFGKNA
jgi:hypothetical protein